MSIWIAKNLKRSKVDQKSKFEKVVQMKCQTFKEMISSGNEAIAEHFLQIQ
jgi:hypothetical protein